MTSREQIRATNTEPLRSLATAWRERADTLRPFSTAAAEAFNRAADELEGRLNAVELQALTLQEAEAESGYSADHLGRMIAKGKIPNAGRPGAPRILRRDLPRKLSSLPAPGPDTRLVGAGPRQIARAVVTSKTGATR